MQIFCLEHTEDIRRGRPAQRLICDSPGRESMAELPDPCSPPATAPSSHYHQRPHRKLHGYCKSAHATRCLDLALQQERPADACWERNYHEIPLTSPKNSIGLNAEVARLTNSAPTLSVVRFRATVLDAPPTKWTSPKPITHNSPKE